MDIRRTSDNTFLTSENEKISYSNIKDSDYVGGVPKRLSTAVCCLIVSNCCFNLHDDREK